DLAPACQAWHSQTTGQLSSAGRAARAASLDGRSRRGRRRAGQRRRHADPVRPGSGPRHRGLGGGPHRGRDPGAELGHRRALDSRLRRTRLYLSRLSAAQNARLSETQTRPLRKTHGTGVTDTFHQVSERRTVLIAPAWPYANGPRHIGHVVGFAVPGDVLARFERLRGSRVLMASGTDEHGTPITYEADKNGIPPREFVDRNNALIVDDLVRLGMTYDIFTRTTTANHYRVTQDLFLKLYEGGYLIEKKQLGAFDAATGRTLPDRYIEGKCPICGYPEARGDQCDNCGNQLDPIDLINPHQRGSDAPVEFRDTQHYFFDLP